jgi:hypothetical protein
VRTAFLVHLFFQRGNQLVPALVDFVFHIEDVLPLAALLPVQFLQLFFSLFLCFDALRLT